LYFLHQQKIPSHLLFIYFIGDLRGPGRNSLQLEREWQPALEAPKKQVGLPKGHSLRKWMHELFLMIDYEEQQKG
jgi:hypothetical protein